MGNKLLHLLPAAREGVESYAEIAELNPFRKQEAEVARRAVALEDARRVYERTNIEARQIGLLRHAEDALTIAQKELRVARERVQRQLDKREAEEARRKQRAPPDLQQLVLDHGAWDRITPEAWAVFGADIAEWKQKNREGAFYAKARG